MNQTPPNKHKRKRKISNESNKKHRKQLSFATEIISNGDDAPKCDQSEEFPDKIKSCSSWIDKYSPDSKEELCVHKKKVDEVQKWLEFQLSFNDQPKGFLLLTGPCGSGKTATIRALCSEKNIEVCEWTNPVNENTILGQTHGISVYTPILAPFEQFLHQTKRYSSIEFSADGQNTRKFARKKLILIEDIPPLTDIYTKNSFHRIILNWLSNDKPNRHPVVFIVSDFTNAAIGETEFVFTPYTVFPSDFLNSPYYHNIQFNPVSKTLLTRLVKSIAAKEFPLLKIPKKTIDLIVLHSCGDIRQAVNILQFGGLSSSMLKDHKAFEKTHGLSHYHMIGRLMHAKRAEDANIDDLRSSGELPELLFDIDEYISTLNVGVSTLSSTIDRNLSNFIDSIDLYCKCAETLSYSDFGTKSNFDAGTSELKLEALIRGMVYNFGKYRERKPGYVAIYGTDEFKLRSKKYYIRSLLVELNQACSVAGCSPFNTDASQMNYLDYMKKIRIRADEHGSNNFSKLYEILPSTKFNINEAEQTLEKWDSLCHSQTHLDSRRTFNSWNQSSSLKNSNWWEKYDDIED